MAPQRDSGQAAGSWREKNTAPHTPVMLDEVLGWLGVRPDGIYVDATLGAGGHSAAIARKLASGTLPDRPSGRLLSLVSNLH